MVLTVRPHALSGVIQARLDRVLPAYETHLTNQGCSAGFLSKLTGTARHLITWLTVSESDVAALDIRGVDGFLSHDCRCPAAFRSQRDEPSAWHAHRVLEYLLETGQAAMPSCIDTGGGLVEAFAGTLTAQGYREATVRCFRSSCRHLIVWLYRSDLTLAEFDSGVLQQFLDHDCACQHPRFFSRPHAFSGSRRVQAMLVRFARFLVHRGVVADWPVQDAGSGPHVGAFLGWMRQHRGARETTLRKYGRSLRALLPRLGDDPGTYDAVSVRTAMLERAQAGSGSPVEGSALRSYLRFLAARGLCPPGLAGAVPSLPKKVAALLPRYVGEGVIEALIASCDTATAIGLRDRAVLLLLARLALRPGEIAALRLDDLDWEQALIRVRGKSRRHVALPLPQEPGDALRDYIARARPHTACATVFPQFRAPHDRLSSSAVSAIVRRVMKRAGIDGDGLPAAYLFRHSRATHLLRRGASLEAVGALLRHASVKTTALYARVDTPMLLAVAHPWPGELP